MEELTKTEDRSISIEVVTPEMAERYLARVPDFQRNLRKSVVTKYANAMERGQWVGGTMIVFDVDGNLIDGQHRLSAQVMSGTTCSYIVQRGAPRVAFQTIDTGARRTMADLANTSNIQASMAVAMTIYEAGCPVSECVVGVGRRYATDIDIADYINAHRELLSNLEKKYAGARKSLSKIKTKPFAIVYDWIRIMRSQEMADWYYEKLADWSSTDKNIIALRSSFTNNTANQMKGGNQTVLLYRAYKMFEEGREANMPIKVTSAEQVLKHMRLKADGE